MLDLSDFLKNNMLMPLGGNKRVLRKAVFEGILIKKR